MQIGRLSFVCCALILGAFACAKPAASPTTANATKGMSVCWQAEDASEGEENARLRKAIGERLETAGYTLSTNQTDCDLRMAWTYATALRNGANEFRSIAVTIRARKEDRILDMVKLHLDPDAAPVAQPEKVALPVVNAMNASARLAQYAKDHAAGPVSTTTTTSATFKRSSTNNKASSAKKPQAGSDGQSWSLSDDVEDMENNLAPESAPSQ